MKKYGFKLKLPYETEIDSVDEIDGHRFCPNYSHAEPIELKGIFDTKEEAEEYAKEFKVYKYILHYCSYDSFLDEGDGYGYFLSSTDAEDDLCYQLGISSEWPVNVTDFEIEEVDGGDKYKYIIYVGRDVYKDSEQEGVPLFDSYEEAEKAALKYNDQIDVEKDIAEITEIEIIGREVYEFDDEDLNNR